MDYAFFCYWHRANDDVFETCINTLSKVSPKAHLQVYTDDRPDDMSRDYGIRWVNVSKDEVRGRRALCKIEKLQKFVRALKHGDRVMVADVDLYFLGDPFDVFGKKFDVAVTTRCHEYRWPVNGGVFFLLINEKTRKFMDFYLKQCQDPTWLELIKFRDGRKYTPDWEIGQDFLCTAWLERESVLLPEIYDAGPEYNYCPNTDVYGIEKARHMIWNAYQLGAVKVLHLKSQLKMSIYDGYMKDAITKRCNGSWNWYEDKSVVQSK